MIVENEFPNVWFPVAVHIETPYASQSKTPVELTRWQ